MNQQPLLDCEALSDEQMSELNAKTIVQLLFGYYKVNNSTIV
jgi:hypothetical protein